MALRRGLVVLSATIALLVAAPPAAAHESYTVQPGDTLSHIAVRHSVTIAELVAENGLGDADHIRVGQTLTIPHGASTETSAPAVAPVTSYTVVSGDTLSEIALRFGVARRDLAEQNGITDADRIVVGQRLAIPAGSVKVTSGVGGRTATTARGAYRSLPVTIVADPVRVAMIPSFERWAAANGLPVDLVMAVAWHESGWQVDVVSPKGAVGVGQLMPETSAWVAADLIGQPNLDPRIADDNIRMSARFLRWLGQYMESEDLALAAYYQGPGSVNAGVLLESTEIYVASVQAHRPFFATG